MIEFTQYLRPNGRKRTGGFKRPEKIERKAKELKELGLLFEAEVLTTGHVSLTIEDDEEVIAIEVVPNSPQISSAVDRLVESAHECVFNPKE